MPDFPTQQSSSDVWGSSDQYRAQATSNWPVASDPYFPYTSLLISGDGPNKFDNNTVLDSGPYNLNVTRSGNVSQGGFSPFGEGWSNYFDGSGDTLTVPESSNLDLTGDFTIEFWVNAQATSYMVCNGSQTGSGCWTFYFNAATGVITYQMAITTWAGVILTTPNNSMSTNTWNHIAVTRSGSSFRLFVNGVVAATATNAGSLINTGRVTQIGYYTESLGTYYLTGYLSNLRIIKGTALYTNNFTPPTQPLTAISGTVLLTCSSNRFLDNSTNNFTITAAGNVTVARNSPFKTSLPYVANPIGSSVYFDGTGDYLTLPASQSSLYLTGAFTWEAWIYPTSNTYSYLYGNWANQAGLNAWSFIFTPTGNFSSGLKLYWYRGNYGTNQCAIGSTTGLTLNKWNHFAITRDASNNIRMFVDGVQLTLITYNEALTWDNSYSFTSTSAIGINGNATYPNSTPIYISNLRFVQGTAVYTANFTPPTEPLTAVSGTNLLTCRGNSFVDDSTNNITITASGNAAISELSPFNQLASFIPSTAGRSVYFDGNGDWLSAPFNTALTFGGGAFTIECWVYSNRAASTSMAIAGIWDSINGAPQSWLFGIDSVGRPYFVTDDGGTPGDVTIFVSSISVLNNTWTHLAVTRSGNTWRLFIDGVINQTATNSLTMRTGSAVFYIGTYQNKSAGDNTFNGYITDFRIVKGTAVYTSNFTPSTEPLTAISGTTLLTCQQGSIVDASTSNIVLTAAGDTAASSLTLKDPYSPYLLTGAGGSVYFDGSGDYLSIPNNSALDLGSSNFTLEGWFYFLNISGQKGLFSKFGVSNGGYLFRYSFESGGQFVCTFDASNGARDTFNIPWTTASTNTWYHIAFVRISNSFLVFVNGTQIGTTQTFVLATTIGSNNASEFRIGTAQTVTSSDFNGYISNIRVIKGTALYTTNFTPPTTLLTPVTNTVLLTCRDNSAFIDRSTSNFTITAAGNPIANSFDPFRDNLEYNPVNISGSLYFDGTGDYLTGPSSVAFALPGDFTVEAWVYITANSALDGGSFRNAIIASTQQSGPTDGFTFQISGSSTTTGTGLSAEFRIGGTNTGYASTATTITQNAWNHVAWVRRGTTISYYLNGVSIGTSTASQVIPTGGTLTIGAQTIASYNRNLIGYISNLRIIKGIALYAATFTPPTAPLKPVAGTSILLEGTNAPVLDHTCKYNIETVGNTQVVTAQSKWGSSSLYFDGNGDYLTLPNTVTVFGTGDFTVECWVNTTVLDSTNDTVISNYNTGSTTSAGLYINRGSTGGVQFYCGTTLVLNGPSALTLANTWYHIAVSRSSGISRLFVNGTLVSSATDTGNYVTDATLTYIGAASTTNVIGNYLNGYIDDLRVTPGIARYTAAFNPPGQFAKM